MLQRIKNKLLKNSGIKKISLVVCTLLISIFTTGSTYAYILTGTPSLTNMFVNGVNPTGDLVISKKITHPFGDSYQIPGGLTFTFDVNLGREYAGAVVRTTQGEKTADENGVISVIVTPGGRTTVFDINKDTAVTVTETALPAGFAAETPSAQLVIREYRQNTVAFTNIYTPAKADTAQLTVKGEKKLEGRDWMEGDSFTFRLEVKENDEWKPLGTQTVRYELVELPVETPAPEAAPTAEPGASPMPQESPLPQATPGETITPETAPVPEDAPVETVKVPKENFDKFDFSQIIQAYEFATAGTYSFRITEIEGTIGGINYDKTESRFDIVVGDADMDGFLEIQAVNTAATNTTVENTQVYVTFINNYAPAGSAEIYINIEKTLDNTAGQVSQPAGFTFDLYDRAGQVVATSDPTDSTGRTAIRMVYTPAEAGREYTYTLKETNAGQTVDYITYDDAEYKIKVTVVDNLDGTVSAFVAQVPAEPQQTPQPETPETPAEDGTQPPEAETPTENTPAPDTTPENGENPENNGENNTPQTPAPDAGREGETEAETPAPSPQPTPETPAADEPSAEPQPTPPAEGADTPDTEENQETEQPEPEVALTNIFTAYFTNEYDPQDTSVVITGEKSLTGRGLRDKEFAFFLYRTGADFVIPQGAAPVQTAWNTPEGVIEFAPLTFDKVGTYCYTVCEYTAGNLGGVTYDQSRYFVTITVKDNNGVLEHTVYITDSHGEEKGIKFENSYKAKPAYLSLPGKKIMNGARLTGDDFFFQAYRADEAFNITGDVVKTAANNREGDFEFKDIAFETAGTHRLVIKEDTSKEKEGLTYDDSLYCITVEITDPGDGQLAISGFTLTKSGETATGIVFENTYTAPVDPDVPVDPDEPDEPDTPDTPDEPDKPTPPDTGDNTNAVVYAGAFAGAAMALVIVLICRKKTDTDENAENQ